MLNFALCCVIEGGRTYRRTVIRITYEPLFRVVPATKTQSNYLTKVNQE